jgi:hypothetical protein
MSRRGPRADHAIYPTHTCFDDVLDHQVELAKRAPDVAARQFIVHGICLFPEGDRIGEPFAHAWVEDDLSNEVWQSGLLSDQRRIWYSVRRQVWRDVMRVQASTRYTLDEVRRLNWQTEHYGPWVPAYRALCRKTSGDEPARPWHVRRQR